MTTKQFTLNQGQKDAADALYRWLMKPDEKHIIQISVVSYCRKKNMGMQNIFKSEKHRMKVIMMQKVVK